MDYTKLRNLLAAKKWKEANEETERVMLRAANREKEGWLRYEDIEKFPKTDFRTMDDLWVKYSSGRFGFSVQKRIWENLGGGWKWDRKIVRKFGDRVGWMRRGRWIYKDEEDLVFDISAPLGFLPLPFEFGYKSSRRVARSGLLDALIVIGWVGSGSGWRCEVEFIVGWAIWTTFGTLS